MVQTLSLRVFSTPFLVRSLHKTNGVIQLTGVASRYVGIWIAALLVILGLLPAVAGVIQAVPQAVLRRRCDGDVWSCSSFWN